MTYVIIKKTMNIDKILGISDVLLSEITQNTEMQKKVYVLGAILGNGIKSGMGILKGKGKFSFEGLIGNVIGNMFGGNKQEQPQGLEQLT